MSDQGGDPVENVDTANGQELEYYPNGQIRMSGDYKNGERHGVWTSWYESGIKRSEVTYKNGLRDGPVITWYENGNMRYKGWYEEDERVRKWKFFNEEGELIKKKEFVPS